MPELFDDLVARYKATGIAFPSLKAVTLAQWILESRRGTSDLATQHLNFAGLKWRAEMVGFAIPVSISPRRPGFLLPIRQCRRLHRGLLEVPRSLAVQGLGEAREEEPGGVHPIHRPDLQPRGEGVLPSKFSRSWRRPRSGSTRRRMRPRRHRCRSSPGPRPSSSSIPATAASSRSREAVRTTPPRHRAIWRKTGRSTSPDGPAPPSWPRRRRPATSVDVVLTRDTDANKGLAARANVARFHRAQLFLSIHFNGFDGKVRGVETLIHVINVNKDDDRALCPGDPALRAEGAARDRPDDQDIAQVRPRGEGAIARRALRRRPREHRGRPRLSGVPGGDRVHGRAGRRKPVSTGATARLGRTGDGGEPAAGGRRSRRGPARARDGPSRKGASSAGCEGSPASASGSPDALGRTGAPPPPATFGRSRRRRATSTPRAR